jgi:hypothetical protein
MWRSSPFGPVPIIGGLNSSFFSTSFPAPPNPENPISEGGVWLHTPNSWTNLATITTGVNHCVGTQSGSSGHDDDSYAYLSSSKFNHSNYQVTATIYRDPTGSYTGGNSEVELHLRMSDDASNARVYECTFGFDNSNAGYNDIVRWNGPLDNFTFLNQQNTAPNAAPATGDQIRATISGSTITTYINYAVANGGNGLWTQLAQVTDSTYTTGQPGIGMWFLLAFGNTIADRPKFGFSYWEVLAI